MTNFFKGVGQHLLRIHTFSLLLCCSCLAGSPTIEIDQARIEKIRFIESGISANTVVLTVTGKVRIFSPSTRSNMEKQWVGLLMDHGEIRFNPMVKHDAMKSYRERIMKLEGTRQDFQMWGTTTLLHEANVTQIMANAVGLLMPLKEEAIEWPPNSAGRPLHRQTDRKAEQGGAGQPATRSEWKPEGGDNPTPESEGRAR